MTKKLYLALIHIITLTYNGDKDYLRDRFVRFAYRFKFIDGEYSIMSPFTQECFIPKQDGYFMTKQNPLPSGTEIEESPPLDIQDEEDTYRSYSCGVYGKQG